MLVQKVPIISKGSVAICLTCGRIFNDDFSENFLSRLHWKKVLWKLVSIWRSYGQEYSGTLTASQWPNL